MSGREGEPARRRLALFLLVPVALSVAVVAGTAAVAASRDPGPGVAPWALGSASPEIAGHYHAARALADVYREVPCFCGCEEFLGHRDLFDCFVRADGGGWEAHAAGCGVCIAESSLVGELASEGIPADQIAEAVIDRFGTTPTTAPHV